MYLIWQVVQALLGKWDHISLSPALSELDIPRMRKQRNPCREQLCQHVRTSWTLEKAPGFLEDGCRERGDEKSREILGDGSWSQRRDGGNVTGMAPAQPQRPFPPAGGLAFTHSQMWTFQRGGRTDLLGTKELVDCPMALLPCGMREIHFCCL